MQGWIKLHRQLQDNPLWTCEPFTRGQAWVDLILLANHTDNYFYLREHKINIKRGQVGYSQLKLSERWKWSRSKVKKFLNDLEKEQQVVQQITHSTTVITIINYNEFQKKEQQVVQQQDNSKTTEEQQQDTNKNVKKENNEENEKKKTFTDFFKLFDYNTGKEKCLQLWLDLDQSDIDKILIHVPDYVKSTPVKKFRKKPENYIKDRTWLDEIVLNDEEEIQILNYTDMMKKADKDKNFFEKCVKIRLNGEDKPFWVSKIDFDKGDYKPFKK